MKKTDANKSAPVCKKTTNEIKNGWLLFDDFLLGSCAVFKIDLNNVNAGCLVGDLDSGRFLARDQLAQKVKNTNAFDRF